MAKINPGSKSCCSKYTQKGMKMEVWWGVSVDICRGSKQRLNVVCVGTERAIQHTESWGCWPCKTDPTNPKDPRGSGGGAVHKIERKRCRKFIYWLTGRSIDGRISPVHPFASLRELIHSLPFPSIYLSIYLSCGPYIEFCTCLSVCLSVCPPIHLPLMALSLHFSIFLFA